MRKWFLLLISFCYLASSSGVAVQWHYCMGKLRSIDVGFSSHEESCSKCGMKKKENSCCNDAVNISKLTDDHQQANAVTFNSLKVATLPEVYSFIKSSEAYIDAENISDRIYPPPGLPNNRTVLFCVFRC
ncbi:hypothetical protein BH10BAC3_BH10BAC3_38630 [soil metagenome]